MAVAEYTLLADSAGSPINPPPEGVEVDNYASRRLVNFDEMGFARLQFGSTSTSVKCEVQYTKDNWATNKVLIPMFDRDVPPRFNEVSDWVQLPEDVVSTDTEVRVMLYGSGQ